MAPSEFWAMHPREILILLDTWAEQSDMRSTGMTRADKDELYQMLRKAQNGQSG